MEERIEEKTKKSFLQHNYLLLAICITGILLYGYGTFLVYNGYVKQTTMSPGSLVAIAVNEISKGVFPWNLNTEKSVPTEVALSNEVNMLTPLPSPVEQNGTKYFMDSIFAITMDNGGVITESGRIEESVSEDFLQEETTEISFETVTDDYFSDAVFIGDSRMVGVYEYAGIDTATFYAKESMSIYGLMDSRVMTNSEVRSVEQGLTEHKFAKVYIMVGINELGTADTQYFIDAYKEVLNTIRDLQPDAVIYIQAIMHVTGEKNRNDNIFNNDNINDRNQALQELANGTDIIYIDINEVYDDENGNLQEEVSADDVHLLGNCYGPWHDFLYTHAIAWPQNTAEY